MAVGIERLSEQLDLSAWQGEARVTICRSRSRKRSNGLTRLCLTGLDLFAEQDPHVLGRDDERLACNPWRLFAADNSKAGCDCSQSRLGRWRRPVLQQHFSRIGDRQDNPVTIDPTGLNDNWLLKRLVRTTLSKARSMLAASDLVGHLKC